MRNIKYNIMFLFALSGLLFASCSEYQDTEIASPKVSASCQAVRFLATNETEYELDQNAASFDLKVVRNEGFNTKLALPVIVNVNEDDMFVIPDPVYFAEGQDTTTLAVSMATTAVKGQKYKMQIAFEGDNVNPYKAGEYPIYECKSAISVWEQLDDAEFYDSFSFYSVAKVSFWRNTLDTTQYRISSPYSVGILEEAEWDNWIGGTTQDKIVFTVKTGDKVTWDNYWYTGLMYQGGKGDDILAYVPTLKGKTEAQAPCVAERDDAGKIIYFALHPVFYIDTLSGGYGAKAVYLGFPGFDLAGELGLPIYGE